MQVALDYLRAQGEIISEDDEARLSPLIRSHINFLGHFSFLLSKIVAEGALRPLNLAEEQEMTMIRSLALLFVPMIVRPQLVSYREKK